MRISIFGLGYVGAVSFGCLVRQGHDVIGVDVDAHKLTLLSKGVSPVVEEGMPELIDEAMRSGRGRVTSDSADAIANSEISFVCVGTPSRRNGAHDLTALRHVCEQIGRAIGGKNADHITVIRSTVSPAPPRTSYCRSSKERRASASATDCMSAFSRNSCARASRSRTSRTHR